MCNVVDYLVKYGKETLLERPFSPEDGLVLAQLSYIKFDGIVPGLLENEDFVSLAWAGEAAKRTELFADMLFAEENEALFDAACASRRFRTMKMNYYVNRIDEERPSQFSAVTYLLEDGSVYIAFRGTDETLTGWREDFSMACRMPVKSQELSAEYLNLAAKELMKRERKGSAFRSFYLGGHSKGGNLAVYAAMHCRENIQARIRRIYNLDGPGFLPCHRELGLYQKIAGRVEKIIPQASVVGMLFEDAGAYRVVKSSARSVMQHDAFSWQIKDGTFEDAGEVKKGYEAAGEILNRWLALLSEEEICALTEKLFGLLERAEVQTVQDFKKSWRKLLREVGEQLRNTDYETRCALWKIVHTLYDAAKRTAREHAAVKK